MMDPGTPALDFFAQLNYMQVRRRLFTTKSGRLGYGPVSAEPGDVICVFDGATVVHVLRLAESRGLEAYTLVGEAYVHGMMNGEIDSLGLRQDDITLV
jgi:hypothetical protein